MDVTGKNTVMPTATAPTAKKMDCQLSEGIAGFDDAVGGVKAGDRRRRDEGERHGEFHSHGPAEQCPMPNTRPALVCPTRTLPGKPAPVC